MSYFKFNPGDFNQIRRSIIFFKSPPFLGIVQTITRCFFLFMVLETISLIGWGAIKPNHSQQSRVSLAQSYGVTVSQLSRAAGLFITKVPEFNALNHKLNMLNLRFGTFGGTSREVMQEVILGIHEAGSFDAYFRKLEAVDSVSYLDWHRLGSDLDLILIPMGPDLSANQRNEAKKIIGEVFPDSLFYKTVDIIWPDRHFSAHPIASEHFEATSDIVVTDAGFDFLPELEATVDGRQINFGRWGVEQFLNGEFEFKVNKMAVTQIGPAKTLIQILRWIRYLSEFSWMNISTHSMTEMKQFIHSLAESHRKELLHLLKSGNSLIKYASNDAEKVILALEKLQLYSTDTQKTIHYLDDLGITLLVREAGIAPQRLLLPLRDRSKEEIQKAHSGIPLGKPLVLYHRTDIQAAQSIGMGAVWMSNNQSIIRGRPTESALASFGLYAQPIFDNLTYGDYFVKLILSPLAVEGVDFISVGRTYVILTRQAIENPSAKGHLQIEKVTSSSLISNSLELLKKGLNAKERYSVLKVLFTLLRPSKSNIDRQRFQNIFSMSQLDHEFLLNLFISNTMDLPNILATQEADPLRQILHTYLNTPYSEGHARLLESFVRHSQLINSRSNREILNKLKSLLRQNLDFQRRIMSNREILDKFYRLDPQLAEELILRHWESYRFNLSSKRDRVLLIRSIGHLSSARDLLRIIFQSVRVGSPADQQRLITELALSHEVTPFQLHLTLSILMNYHHLISFYYPYLPSTIKHNDPINSEVMKKALGVSQLSSNDLNILYLTGGFSDISPNDLASIKNILFHHFQMDGQKLLQIPGLSTPEKVFIVGRIYNLIKQSPSDIEKKVNWLAVFEGLSRSLVSMFIDNLLSPKELVLLQRQIPDEFIPQFSEDIKMKIYELSFGPKNESLDLSPFRRQFIQKILAAQKSLPFSLFTNIIDNCLRFGTGSNSYVSIVQKRLPSPSELKFLYDRFIESLNPETTNVYNNSLNVPDIPILSSWLLQGKGWNDRLYDRLASSWEYSGQPKLLEYIRSAPEFPVSWQKNIALDITSGEVYRMSTALAIMSSRRHSIPALERLFQTQFKDPNNSGDVEKVKNILGNMVYQGRLGSQLYFSPKFWSWLFSYLKIYVEEYVEHPSANPNLLKNPGIKLAFQLVVRPTHSNAPDWFYRKIFEWLQFDVELAKDLLQSLAHKNKDHLPASMRAYIPKEGDPIFDSLDLSTRVSLNELRTAMPLSPGCANHLLNRQ